MRLIFKYIKLQGQDSEEESQKCIEDDGAGLEHSHAGEMLTGKQKVKILKSSSAGVILPNKEKANVSECNA
jgi:hypothetical protein